MEITRKGAIRRRRSLHLSQLRRRILILTDNNSEIIWAHSPDRSIRLSYRPAQTQGCHLLGDCVKLGDGTPVKTLLLCGTARKLLVSLPVSTDEESVEISVLRLFHDEKLPILQAIEGANEIAAAMTEVSPALFTRMDRSLKVILSGCNRLLGTITSVSDSAAGALDGRYMWRRRVEMVRHVREICMKMTSLALEGGIHIRCRSNVSRLDAVVDTWFITRIVENLLSNAVKYTPSGGEVQVCVDMLSDEWMRLSVIDNGPGVPREIRGRLFDRFVTGRGDARAGAGLGLYNVRMFAEKMGGKVCCVSAPGQGARFDVDLPLFDEEQPDAAAAQQAPADALLDRPKARAL